MKTRSQLPKSNIEKGWLMRAEMHYRSGPLPMRSDGREAVALDFFLKPKMRPMNPAAATTATMTSFFAAKSARKMPLNNPIFAATPQELTRPDHTRQLYLDQELKSAYRLPALNSTIEITSGIRCLIASRSDIPATAFSSNTPCLPRARIL
jgi:hypothetical protein